MFSQVMELLTCTPGATGPLSHTCGAGGPLGELLGKMRLGPDLVPKVYLPHFRVCKGGTMMPLHGRFVE